MTSAVAFDGDAPSGDGVLGRKQESIRRPAPRGDFLSAILAWPKSHVWLAALVLVVSIGWLDFVTGWELDSSALYALPVVFVVWKMDRPHGFALALLCMVVWWATRFTDHPYHTGWGFALALGMRLLFLSTVIVAAAAVKAHWQLSRARIEMLERIQALELDIRRTCEEEQQRIGRDLHDGLCQTLSGVAALSSALSRKLAARAEPGPSATAAEITRLLNEAIGEARDLARGLDSAGLRETGLAGALEGLAFKAKHLFGLSCTVGCKDPLETLEHEDAAHLFRIAQEAVNNAVAHGGADRIEISLGRTDVAGFLNVRDNGSGLSKEALRSDGIGMSTMIHRAHLIGGSLDVRPRADGGTTVTCVFPAPTTPASRENLDRLGNNH
jgi:signal transduction histidine kinase